MLFWLIGKVIRILSVFLAIKIVKMIAQYIEWGPKSYLFQIGGFELRWYSLCFALAFYLGYKIVKGIFDKEKIEESVLDKLLMYMVIATVLGARLGHVIFYEGLSFIVSHPIETFLPFRIYPEFEFTGFSGLASHGGAIGILIALYFFSKKISKKPMLWILDRVAPAIALASCFIRTGNLMNSEIIGNPTELPWGFVFTQIDNIPRHPAQLYEALSYLIIFLVLYKGLKKKDWLSYPGKLFGFMVLSIFTARFLIEFVKKSQGGFEESWELLSTGQWLSMPFIALGIYLLQKSKQKKAVS